MWTSVSTLHDERVYSQWTHGGRASLFVSDHVVGSSDAAGGLIGYPPLHQHHFHYSHASDPYREMLNSHGDLQCLDAEEGVDCLLVEYPAHTAFELVPQINIFAEFIDVRASGAAALHWYALGGVFIHNASEAPRLTVMRWATAGLAPLSVPAGISFGHGLAPLYDTATPCVSWVTGTLSGLDYVVDAYFHAHPAMVDDLWLLAGSPAQLGLHTPPWIFAFQAASHAPSVIGDFKRHLTERTRDSAAHLICAYNALPHVEEAGSEEEGNSTGSFTRRFTRRARCLFRRAFRGDLKWTMVGFFAAQVPNLPAQFPMHTVCRIAYVALPGTANDAVVRSEAGVPRATLSRLASDSGSLWHLIRWFGGVDTLAAWFLGDGLGWSFQLDAGSPWAFVVLWASAPLALPVLALALVVRCYRRYKARTAVRGYNRGARSEGQDSEGLAVDL